MPAFRSSSLNPWPPVPAGADHDIQGHGETVLARYDPRHQASLVGQQYNCPAFDTTVHRSLANSAVSLGGPQLQLTPDSLSHVASAPGAIDPIRHDVGLQEAPISILAADAGKNKAPYGRDSERLSTTSFPPMNNASWTNGQPPQSFTAIWSKSGIESASASPHVPSGMPTYSPEAPPSPQLAHLAVATSSGPISAYEPRVGAPGKVVEASSHSDNSSSRSPYTTYAASLASYGQSNTLPLPSGPSSSGPSSQQSQYWVLQPSMKQNAFRQSSLDRETDQILPKAHVPEPSLPNSDTIGSNQVPAYHQSVQTQNVAEDIEISDLEEMTRVWFISHIAGYDDALRHVPLEELGKQVVMVGGPSFASQGDDRPWNIVKIENIPYNLDDDMLFEFLATISKGKTMDCFLEFPTAGTAERFVQKRYNNNRRCMLGGRHISLELVKQGELMRWLFPKTKGGSWADDGNLVIGAGMIQALIEIISREELVMILGHARTPHRSPFSRKCLQRPYESLMSVITKFPWKETAAYTLRQRDLIFQAAFEAGELLKRQILRGKTGPNIDLKLLRRLCRTISFCPGFTYRQKLTFLDAMGITTTECFAILGDLGISHPLATQFQALTVKPGADYVAVEAIARLVAGGVVQQPNPDQDQDRSQSQSQSQSHSHKCSTLHNMGGEPGLPRGPSTEEGAAESSGGDVDLTMRAAAEIELRRVYAAIKTTFEKQNQEPILS
ncbi:hypothetical protein Dda_2924 [Drechslerella dactyloides]|uniref:Uncharacterized protein n=1 Tax=Drechslerella dactyloides TaxID=74499 RepID=A0AAD6NKS3_DREDA|nr:hypothetical protein Dda_2924 [Drechslerella dactyloides]